MTNTLEESAEAVYICDQNDCILAVNRAMCRITGYSPDQLKGSTPDILDTHDKNECIEERTQTVIQRGFWQGEVTKRMIMVSKEVRRNSQ